MGARYLYDEVPPGVEWSDPENNIMFFGGPLSWNIISGAGTVSVVTTGPMNNLAVATQACIRPQAKRDFVTYAESRIWPISG